MQTLRGDARSSPSGSCRDIGWLLVQLLRHLGLAARFVSGYLIQLTPDVKPLDGPERPDARLHRPARLVRGLPARRRLDRPRPDVGPARRRRPHPARLHARAVERRADRPARSSSARSTFALRDDGDAHPRDAARHQALHRGAVGDDRSRSATRSTPTSARRRAADDGRRADVRLDRRHATATEWNTAALGPDQAAAGRRAAPPACASASRPAAAAALRPGQVVSRRAAAALGARLLLAQGRRADLARPASLSPTSRKPTAPRRETAHRFCAGLRASACGVDPSYLFGRPTRTPGTTCGASGGCPVNVDPLDAASSTTRWSASGCARVFEQGLDSVVGYVLPLRSATQQTAAAAGAAGRGSCAREQLYLIPGDSPMGYRLPLDSLPWAAPADADLIAEPDPMAPHPPLPPLDAFRRAPVLRRQSAASRRAPTATATHAARPGGARWRPISAASPAPAHRPAGIVRTALCVEPRDGRLHVFMPPRRRARGLPRAGRRRRGHRRASSACRSCIEGYPPPQRSAPATASASRPTPA